MKIKPSCFLCWWIKAKWFASSFVSLVDKQSSHWWVMHLLGKSSLTIIVGDRSCHVSMISLMNASNCSDSDPWEMAKIPSRMPSGIKVVIPMVLLRGDKSSFDEAYFTILLYQPNGVDWLILASEPAAKVFHCIKHTKLFNFQMVDEIIAIKVEWILWLMAPVWLCL